LVSKENVENPVRNKDRGLQGGIYMNDKLKTEILSSLRDILEKNKEDCQNTLDLFNVVKIIDNYEEFEPDIKNMLNERARKDKWGER
jgi:hypothetical protein